MSNYRLNGFTLMELLIAMMVSSLLLTVVVLSLQNFHKAYYQLLEQSALPAIAYQNHSLIREDFLDHQKVQLIDFRLDDRLELTTDTIYYYPVDSGFIARRRENHIDSFLMSLSRLEQYNQYQANQEAIKAFNKSFFSHGH